MNTVLQADCVEGMRKMADGSVDLAFADPPFNIGYKYDVYHDRLKDDEYLGWTADWMREVVRVLKPSGTFWLAIGDEYAAEMKVLMQRDLGLYCRSWVIWYFAGSGTTLAVAKKLGRRFLGFELSKQYSDFVKARLEKCRPGDPLDGAPEPLASAPKTEDGVRLEDRLERNAGKKRFGRRRDDAHQGPDRPLFAALEEEAVREE